MPTTLNVEFKCVDLDRDGRSLNVRPALLSSTHKGKVFFPVGLSERGTLPMGGLRKNGASSKLKGGHANGTLPGMPVVLGRPGLRRRPVAIGERRRPDPQGRPGYLRVDTVHQVDWDGSKGVYTSMRSTPYCSGK
jgi:hypothetical protein